MLNLRFIRGALVALLFCIAALWLAQPAKGLVTPVTTKFNDPVIWWNSYYIPDSGLLPMWDKTMELPGAKIAIVDSGMQLKPDLPVPAERHNVLNGSTDVHDNSGHGTMMASITSAQPNNGVGTIGVCPRCPLVIVKATNSSDGTATYDNLAAGVRWAANDKAAVILVAFSAAEGESSQNFNRQVAYATSMGATVVIASGNGPNNNGKGTDDPRANLLAAQNPEALRATASGSFDDGATVQLNPSSNFGKKLADATAWGYEVPVDTINSEDLKDVSGSSAASAFVTGVLGSAKGIYAGLTPAQQKWIIMNSCDLWNPDMPCGGLVNADSAISLAGSASVPASVYLHVKLHGKGKVWISSQAPCKKADCRYGMIEEQVTLAAAASSGWHFVRWTGGILSRNARLSVNLKTALTLKAVFAQNVRKKSKDKRR
jgi:hypothetical protein